MPSDVSIARELFARFGGDPYLMEREGVLQEYRAFAVGKDTEKVWARESCQSLLNHFREHRLADSQTLTLVKLIKDFRDDDELIKLLLAMKEMAAALDSFTILRLCEEITRGYTSQGDKGTAAEPSFLKMMRLVSDLLQFAQTNPITVHSYYHSTPHLPETLEEDRLRLRISKLANEVRLITERR